ncbi:Bifunctional ligase/repressor BirA [Tepidimonas alkaliphilus]|uniref:biotin--[biotin carboxyl-carrier protein] ligase n=1 Tax=Tepidimonas alkaliphilus TaxID=2588942 RepID=A0A554WBN6_9BURK|nr:biotin--[acetyl-CoA-carboxylase] ligase [Tepidimonas alkaliphilus]TSE20987.1 Bifunctional ligase/repressor BirA [Tepidimonas alkaliphilus]
MRTSPPAPDDVAALQALHAGAVQAQQTLRTLLPDLHVETVAHIDSTNAELLRRARTGLCQPALLAALAQSAGRGRHGRPWVMVPQGSLAFSVGLPLQPVEWSGLSLVAGVALARALPPDVRLKWPNDLVWHARKLGGILIETVAAPGVAARYAVIGVGLNLATPALPPQAPLDALPPAGLHEVARACGQPPEDAGTWLARLAPALVQAVRRFETEGFAPWQASYGALDALAGLRVRISDGREGVADGVTADGALRLRTADGRVVPVQAGEVSVRPC